MIRMIQSTSAKQAKSYFSDALSKSDYYLNDQELPGEFHGKLVKRIGLAKAASAKAFKALCDNLHPVSGKPLTTRQKQHRTIGYDINFHVPKSVSVLHVLSKDDHILDAFKQSVQETMQDIENDTKTRVRRSGKDEERETRELLWAEFIHQTARPTKNMVPDPHLHAHCFAFNVTWDKIEKRYKAGQFRDIKRDMPYYQALFHKRLSDSLMQLGYSIRRTKNSFEIDGVPSPVIDLFSKRTNEIGQLAKDYRINDAKELDKLGAKSRAKKQKGLSLHELKKQWRKQIHAMGAVKGGSGAVRFGQKKPAMTTDRECLDFALAHHFERVSVVQDRRILEAACHAAIGKQGASVSALLRRFKTDKRIIKIKDGSKIVCTTLDALAEEREMIDLANKGKGKFSPLYRAAPPMSLSDEQAEAVGHVLTTPHCVSIIQGRAGTGKTTLMKEAVSLIEKTGKKVMVVAPTAQASRGVLKDEGFQDAETVAKLLNSPSLHNQLQDAVLWVDEAGLLSNKDMLALLKLATDRKARVILSGDTRQHSSVERGDALRILNTVAGIQSVNVNRIYRQKDKTYKMAVEAIAVGDIKSGYQTLAATGSVRQLSTQKLNKKLAAGFVDVLKAGKTALAVSPTHEQSQLVTASIRQRLKENGLIKKQDHGYVRLTNLHLTDAQKGDALNYPLGSIIQFIKSDNGIKRGSRWTVMAANGKDLVIQNGLQKQVFCPEKKKSDIDVYKQTDMALSEGDSIVITKNGRDANSNRLNNGQMLRVTGFSQDGAILAQNEQSKVSYQLPADYGHLNHGYCITSHASQGKTVDHVFLAQPAATFPATDMKQFYVSVSRGRHSVTIYTDDKQSLFDHIALAGDRVSASELIGHNKPDHTPPFLQRRQRKVKAETPINQLPNPPTKARSHEYTP